MFSHDVAHPHDVAHIFLQIHDRTDCNQMKFLLRRHFFNGVYSRK